jgi:hypothetical protein
MSHRNLPVDPVDFTLIIDGKKTNIPAFDKDTIKALKWERYLNNISPINFHTEPEKNAEYF